ncbi:MAG: hypothetical protein JXC32_08135 [Anaerolineae bacterium]|nr:hypothetical protein [Anaerolineae bacterium]
MIGGSFSLVSDFDFAINRAERTQQVRWLVPLLTMPEGRVWFLREIECPCSEAEARHSRPYHLAFPLRDLFTADFYACRQKPEREKALIAYYNGLFGLPSDYDAETFRRRHPGGPIRHPAAPGRSGWHRDFLAQHVTPGEAARLMRIRQLLDTEADALLILPRHVVIIECKYLSNLSQEQYDRQMEMGPVLARRLGKTLHFGLVVQAERDVVHARIQEPYVTWDAIAEFLSG